MIIFEDFVINAWQKEKQISVLNGKVSGVSILINHLFLCHVLSVWLSTAFNPLRRHS